MKCLLEDFKKYLKENEEEYKNGSRDSIEYPLGYMEVKEIVKEIERLHSIIKEVREYIKQNEFYLDYKTGACIKGVMPLLEILDKVDKENKD